LPGQNITEAKLIEMAEIAATEVDPMDDNRGSAEYKREMVKVLVRWTAQDAVRRASEN
jgi:CO/xanthine dehydrogenase FAD-binding subunit